MSINDSEHLQRTNERDLMKFAFIAGLIVGASLMFGLIHLLRWAGINL